ncbi:MAG: cob(I)yrinic acid a,c-diamide adenosyltransferase, partial [Bacillota bacterium]
VVLDLGMLSCEEVIECLKERPQHVEVVLTGRKAPKAILDMADLITEMRCIRHPYERGIPARLGIEY